MCYCVEKIELLTNMRVLMQTRHSSSHKSSFSIYISTSLQTRSHFLSKSYLFSTELDTTKSPYAMSLICFISLMPSIFYKSDHRCLQDHLYDMEKRLKNGVCRQPSMECVMLVTTWDVGSVICFSSPV